MLHRLPFTSRGALALMVGAGLCAASFAIRLQALLWPGIFLIALPVASWAMLWLVRPRLLASRTAHPPEPAVGDDLELELRLRQRSFGLPWTIRVIDQLPAAFGGPHAFTVTAPAAGHEVSEIRTVRPAQRGRYLLSNLRFGIADSLGLAWRGVSGAAPVEVIVTPQVLPLGGLPAAASERTGETPIPHLAFDGPDDVLVREYRPRDDVRRIHWPSTARTGTLMVRREERTWDPGARLILDTRAGSYNSDVTGGQAFERSVTLAASVGVALLDAGHQVALSAPDGTSTVARAGGRHTPASELLRHLATVELTPERPLSGSLRSASPGTTSHVVVAILGRLSLADARVLAPLSDGHQTCWGLYVLPGGAEEAAALTLLRNFGWRMIATPPQSDVSATFAGAGATVGA